MCRNKRPQSDKFRQVVQHEGSRIASVVFSCPCCALGDSSASQAKRRDEETTSSHGGAVESGTQ